MFLARLTFGSDCGKPRERDALEDAAEWYLGALIRNGQIYGEYLFSWHDAMLVVYAHLARPDSLAARHNSEWARKSLDSVVEGFGHPPKCEIIEDDVPKRFPAWKRSDSFYLFTHAFDDKSPICSGDTGRPMPLYLLPLPELTRESIHFWSRSYNYHDYIWLDSAALEMPAYKQLADPTSNLSMRGRELCAEVERATNIPTYYYLKRYWGRNKGEAVRLCPGCGGEWHLSDGVVDERPFWDFHFRCERCRLVSHRADSYEDERHARIGEFKKSK
ncbi:MAG: DUF2310 family Zn-ribbon-containing protein [Acidobacteriota bacterium]|nr:MAG: DUF2310 family Zn-ribbon-containing protein [Acidobacteriota bacterium]